MREDRSMWFVCPECYYVGKMDDFDILGADPGNVFCNNCGVEIPAISIADLIEAWKSARQGPHSEAVQSEHCA